MCKLDRLGRQLPGFLDGDVSFYPVQSCPRTAAALRACLPLAEAAMQVAERLWGFEMTSGALSSSSCRYAAGRMTVCKGEDIKSM